MESQGTIEFIDPGVDRFLKFENPELYTDQPDYYRYLKQVIASEGFTVDYDPDSELFGIIVPSGTTSKPTIRSANFAIQEFNKLKGTNFELRRILKSNFTFSGGLLLYMTLECTDGCFYEAQIFTPFGKDSILGIFRPAKQYTSSSDSNSSDPIQSSDN